MVTRFASLPPALARLLLAAVAALIALGLAQAPSPAPRLAQAGEGDTALYRAIAARADTLPAYYAAATAEQRARGYPLRPFVTVREPALALLTHRLGAAGVAWAWRLLALAAFVALAATLMREIPRRGERLAAVGLAAFSVLLLAQPALAAWHEAWAGMLLVAALALAARSRWLAACGVALAALLLRELALPAVLALGAAAALRGRRREAGGWVAVVALFALALAGHAAMVAAHVLPGDPGSPGWSSLGGWRFVLGAAHRTSLFALVPLPLAAVLLPLALLGWAAPATPLADRVALALAATLGAFLLVGRPDNFYWGLVVAPLLAPGLAFAPAALRDLARQVLPGTPSVAAWSASASS